MQTKNPRASAGEIDLSAIPNSDVTTHVLAHVGEITMLQQTAVQALNLASDIETSIMTFADIIQRDVKLATDIMSMANSVIYSPGKTTASLPQAILRLGFEQCKNVILASSVHSAMCSLDLKDEWIRVSLSRHSVITGTIAVNLNRHLRCGFAGEEFAAGLVHDFGRMLLAAAYKDEFASFDALRFDDELEAVSIENSRLGSNHCQVGAWFAAKEGLPDVLCEVIRYHHSPDLAERYPRITILTAIADHMANHYQRYGESLEYDPASNPHLGLLEKTGIRNAVEHFRKFAGDLLSHSIEEADEMMVN